MPESTKSLRSRICCACNILKPIDKFYKTGIRHGKVAYRYSCKSCVRKYQDKRRSNNYAWDKAQYKTKYGFLKRKYHTMVCLCNCTRPEDLITYHGVKVLFTKEEFISRYIKDKDFLKLFKQWEALRYQKKLSPVASRINKDLHFSFDNIQWMTLQETSRKAVVDRREKFNANI